MRKSFKVSISSMLAVLIFVTQFVSLSYISWYNLLRYGVIVAVGIYVFKRIKIVLQKKYALINLCALVFSLLTVYTSYLNRSRAADRDPFLAAIPFVASFFFFLLFMEIMVDQEMVKRTIRVFYKTAFVLALFTDILIFTVPSLFRTYHVYFVGTKFGVVYLHLILLIFYLTQNALDGKKSYEKATLLFFAIWSFLISVRVNCSTGIVGVLILLSLYVIVRNKEELFLNGWFYIGIQTLCFGFVFFYDFVLSNSTVEHLIVNFLGRDLTLTYRTVIYEMVPVILTTHDGWMRGMGYGSSYELGMRYGGFSDTQNGILEWIWQVGVPTTIVMVLMFALILIVSKKCICQNNRKMLQPLISGLYLFTILGTVEITISLMYFSLAVCIMGVAAETGEYAEANAINTDYDRNFIDEKIE